MVRILICVALFPVAVTSWASDSSKASRLFDADDGWLDLSQFLDTAYGFVPLISPITEPAVGYGAAAGTVWCSLIGKTQARNSATRVQTLRPSVELRPKTERADSLQDTSEHGLTADCARRPPSPMPMSIWIFLVLGAIVTQAMQVLVIRISARGGAFGGSYRLGQTSLWLGLRYTLAKTKVSLDQPTTPLPE